MIHKENWEETKKHLEAFWNKAYYKRCDLAIRVPCAVDNEEDLLPLDCQSVEESYTSPDYLYASWKNSSLRYKFLGEGIPVCNLNFGTAGHVEYFGATPHYAPDTIWFSPILDEPDASLLQYDLEGEAFERHKEITRRLTQKAAGEFMVSMPDNCGIIDGLAELRGSENLLIDMLENPEFVHESRQKIIEAWKATQKGFFEILAENNEGGSSHSWMQLWCPKRHAQIQCDFSVMISPAMYEEFVLPEIEECVQFLDTVTYHLDGQEQNPAFGHALIGEKAGQYTVDACSWAAQNIRFYQRASENSSCGKRACPVAGKGGGSIFNGKFVPQGASPRCQ